MILTTDQIFIIHSNFARPYRLLLSMYHLIFAWMYTRQKNSASRPVYLRFAPYLFSFLFIPFCFKQFSHVNLHKGKTTNFTMVHKRDAVIETYFSIYQKQFLTMFDSNSNIMQINGRLPTYFNGRCQSYSTQTVCDSILANDFCV